jgi:RNA polymerase sigma factor (sigma-70 family)
MGHDRGPRAYAWTAAYRAYIRHALHDAEVPVAEVPEPAAVLPLPGNAEAWLQEQQVLAVLRALPPRQRQVLALVLDGWSPAEIADLLGMEPPAVRASLKKARRAAEAHRRHQEEGP